jgi:plastocyanin
MNSKIAVVIGLAAVLAAMLAPISSLTPAFAADVAVSITSGASSKTTDAFSPNPVNAMVGDTVTWTNDDSQPHTVVSGDGKTATPDGKFDSSPNFNPLIKTKETFSVKFNETGDYPYYCALHPNMLGTVKVAAGGTPPPPPPPPQQKSFSVTATADGNDYMITGSGNATATSATINAGKSVTVTFDSAGSVSLTLPKAMIDQISTVNGETVTIVSQNDSSTTISFTVPEGKSVEIMGTFVVPEFPVIAAILVASIAAFIGYTRFAGKSAGFFGRA